MINFRIYIKITIKKEHGSLSTETFVERCAKEFIEENRKAIEEGDWGRVYSKLGSILYSAVRIELNKIFENSGILYTSILHEIAYIPPHFLEGCSRVPDPLALTSNIESIYNYGFAECDGLTSITIPDSVTSIGDYAFHRCYNLKRVFIRRGVTSIGEGVFSECSGLTSITIPDSVTSIGGRAFYFCDKLTDITISNNVTSIGEGTFGECENLKSITIPNSITSIGDNVFFECRSLTSVTIPERLVNIGYDAFSYCSNLEEITFLGTKKQWKSIKKNPTWRRKSGIRTIHCTDGDIQLKGI